MYESLLDLHFQRFSDFCVLAILNPVIADYDVLPSD